MLKRFLFLICCLFFSASCAGAPDCFRAEVFCAALVTDTLKLSDDGMNADAWLGLQDAKANGDADEIAYIESIDTRDYEKNIAYFAARGYDVIVTVNPGMSRQTLRAADLYPDSVFVGLNQRFEEGRPNLIPVIFAEDQMGFLAGALAARLTRTRVVAAVCETAGIDSMWRYCEGFRAGVLYVNDQVKVLVVYREGEDRNKLFIDDAWGYETGWRLARSGADVIFAAGGGTGQGALRAAVAGGIYAIGAERDQAGELGASRLGVVTSVYGDARVDIQELMRLLRSGNADAPRLSHIKILPLNDEFPQEYTHELQTLLEMLFRQEVKTNIPLMKP